MSNSFDDFLTQGFEQIDTLYVELCEALAEVLRRIGEPELARLVRNPAALEDADSLPGGAAQTISLVFQLLNLVEEHTAHQVARRRESQEGIEAEPGRWGYWLKKLHDQGVQPIDIIHRCRAAVVEPVLTGHPTEAKRWTVLDQHRELFQLLHDRANSRLTDFEKRKWRRDLCATLECLWRTGEIFYQKPNVDSERAHMLFFLKEVFPPVLKELDSRFDYAWEEAGYDPTVLREPNTHPLLRFGSWVGGDRDGHPGVTPKVSSQTLKELRAGALDVLDNMLAELHQALGLSWRLQSTTQELEDRTVEISKLLGELPEPRPEEAAEPWKRYVRLLRGRLAATKLDDHEKGYRFPLELRADLMILRESLLHVGAHALVQEYVRPVQRAIETFGFHLACLDIRQNSAFHDRAVSQLMAAAGIEGAEEFPEWPEAKRREFLEAELQSPRPFSNRPASAGEEAAASVGALQVAAKHIRKYGRGGLGAVIVSMTRNVSDLLVVYLLAREAGLTRPVEGGLACLLPVVPLFETLDDLERSPGIVASYLAHPITQRSLSIQHRIYDEQLSREDWDREDAPEAPTGPRQMIMLGYSDSNKDAGIIASAWALRQAQERILAVGQEASVDIQFFHGRGGTISRGAGPTHRFMEALALGSLNAGIRVTEQGEVIGQKYNNHRSAAYHLELLMAGAVGTGMDQQKYDLSAPLVEALDQLAAASRKRYRQLLEDKDFMTFYRQATPIDVLEHSRIGSRPTRRRGQQTLDDLRAIPWVFSWNQARFYLPGWFGVGTALTHLQQNHRSCYLRLRDEMQTTPLLRYLFYNLESSATSADSEQMKAYASLVEEVDVRERLLGVIHQEYQLTRQALAALFGRPLPERRPRFYKTLQYREVPLKRLHREQIRLLRKWRNMDDNDPDRDNCLEDMLICVNAIASGLRTTG
ncbi:MAG: phosphoenolpyruvate carboxylase [Verrucomicrobiota bacterium JB022]|nr:phosphoenolpyruvate carboxylase [Verrucomicrobiota bacterium JB022]